MALSDATEHALQQVVNAAEAMQKAGRRWGRTSKELELATKVYEMRMQEYYDSLTAQQNLHWEQYCKDKPDSEECRIYDV